MSTEHGPAPVPAAAAEDGASNPPQAGLPRSYLAAGGLLVVIIVELLVIAWHVRPAAGGRPLPPVPSATALMVSARGSGQLAVGQPAPDFGALDLDEQPVELNALRGRPVWINFWATWCPPCKTEMPLMEQKYQQYRAEGLVLIGVNLQEAPEAVRAWVGDRFGWHFLLDRDGKLADLYQVEGLPSHIFIDRAGVTRGLHIGPLDAAQMDAQLAPILGPAEAPSS